MRAPYRRRISLMPAVAMAALSALVAIPALSQSRLYAAPPQHFTAVTVRTGESLWAIADRYTPADGNVQETVDQIMAVNHLHDATLEPGQRLTIPR
ncbi:MAG: LysM peptidoglycan-binding domain-containing protein [Vulcanimicrobiaceae bacterium]